MRRFLNLPAGVGQAAPGAQPTSDRCLPGMESLGPFDFELITPMFGGGVEAGIVDATFPIRPAAIRHHLRWWWRATRGSAQATVESLALRESEIFGTTSDPSEVTIEVLDCQTSEPAPCARYEQNKKAKIQWEWPVSNDRSSTASAIPYALFPFQGKGPAKDMSGTFGAVNQKDPANWIRSGKFRVRIKFPTAERLARIRKIQNELRKKERLPPLQPDVPDIRLDLECALWAWANFGGLGSRTRRGCGALFSPHCAPPRAAEFASWLEDQFRRYSLRSVPMAVEWPQLRSCLFLAAEGDPIAAWGTTIETLRDFRQGENIGRRPGSDPGKPLKLGRSFWPEPDRIRRESGTHLIQGSHTHAPITPYDACFPRAEFGLPIITHFIDGPRGTSPAPRQDPADSTILPVVNGVIGTRMASPLVLRPIACGDEKVLSAIVVMRGPELKEAALEFTNQSGQKQSAIHPVRLPGAALNPQSPMGPPSPGEPPRSAQGSSVEAFLSFARKERGFSGEVSR